MKKINMLLTVLFMVVVSIQAQTMYIYKTTGVVEEFATANIDSILFTEAQISSSSSIDISSSSSSIDVSSSSTPVEDDNFLNIALTSSVTEVQPMTGIVLWNDAEESSNTAIQLEYSYCPFNKIVTEKDPATWDWSWFETFLNSVSGHNHQAIPRFYYVYPGDETTVPQYIKDLSDYNEIKGSSEGETTYFPDWSHSELKAFTKLFYTEFAARYDNDPRVAFLQVGFGLWGEYHIYDPSVNLGVNFPDFAYQEEFLNHLDATFTNLPWSISIDASNDEDTPFATITSLKNLDFGLFDDSFLNEEHTDYNKECFAFFGEAKRQKSPVGGEFSYFTDYDQANALKADTGPYGTSYEVMAAQYNVTYMIGNDQPEYQTMARIKEAGLASGYNFEITSFKASSTNSIVKVKNTGIAPIFYDTYIAINGVRSTQSLKLLLPNDEIEVTVAAGGTNPTLTIECDRLVAGQEIQFDASLN